MHYLLKNYIRENVRISEEQLHVIAEKFTLRKITKGTILLRAGEVCREFYFVNKGVVRTYYLSAKGSEKSRYFAFEGGVCTALGSFIWQQPSGEYMDVLEDAEVLSLNHVEFQRLLKGVEEWQHFYLRLLEFAYMHTSERVENFVTLTPKERYDLLAEKYPWYIKRLPSKMIASYLDVTQETLSRLKAA